MTPSRSPGRAEDSLHPDDSDGYSHPNHEQSTLLASGQFHSPLSEEEEDEAHAREVTSWKRLPWWKRPSPYWVIFGIPFGSIGFSALLAPKVAMYTTLACRVHRPEYITNDHFPHTFAFPPTHNLAVINAPDGSETAVNTASIFLPNPTYTPSSDYSQNGPDYEQKCASDPVVQAVVARLNAVFTTAMGILSCLTTGWWGSMSDRYGRRNVIFVSIFGFFVTDVTHVITAWFVDVLPFGYWFPLVGYLIEGVCGSEYFAQEPSFEGYSTECNINLHAQPSGLFLGGLLIRSTGTILSVFYFASILHGLYSILILFILPESLTRARARGARLRRRQEKANEVPSGRALGVMKSITRFLSPLVVLLPEQSLDTNPLKRKRRDWSLFCIAIAFGLGTSILGSFSYKFQYAASQFSWTPELTSYYVSFIGATRAFFLAVVLPLIIKYLKPTTVQLPCTPDEPLRGAVGLSPTRDASSPPDSAQTNASEQRLPASRSPAFDLALARASAGMEITAFLGMAIASTGALFTLASTIGSFGAGFTPAVQALALDIYTNRRSENRGEVGKLFGALSVLEALGAQIISPAVYGFVYFNTVATFPQAIMIVSMCTSLLSLTFLSFVRLPSKSAGDRVAPEHGNESMAAPEILAAIEDQVVEGR
ncbi:hypothetical protein J3R82DRAFT_6020 [Butyriboletus roseoflavus]|nr:hypothetical protein J3R82DRAFT_6020 [Butyriboletus roseoflavus]